MLPNLKNIPYTRSMVNEFYGYNDGPVIGEGEFSDENNLMSDYFPVLASRHRRVHIKRGIKSPHGMCANEKLAYVNGTSFYYGSEHVCDVSDSDKIFACMGALICIFPDRIIYNTKDGTVKNMDEKKTVTGLTVQPCTLDGGEVAYSASEPQHTDGAYWLDGGVLKKWSESYGMWVSVPASYLKISAPHSTGLTDGFSEDDVVNISGCEKDELNGDFKIYRRTDDCLVISAVCGAFTQETPVTVKREAPEMDFVCEHNNRIWGCSSEKHEIYACRQGDPSNWRSYTGLVSDSYAATVGSAGDFTGCISHGGYVLFFKENCIHRLYGNAPANFSVTETGCRGVMKGCERSLCVLNGTVYYQSREGICAYDGSLPVNISEKLSHERFFNAAAGVCTGKYVVSMQGDGKRWFTFTYDVKRRIWHRENDRKILFFANDQGALYCMDGENITLIPQEYIPQGPYPGMDTEYDGEVTELCPGMVYPGQVPEGIFEKEVEWFFETGDIGMETPDFKYVSKIILRLQADKGYLKVLIMYDSDGIWEKVLDINGTKKRSLSVPVRVRRCDHARIRIMGTGEVKIYSIARNMEQGSEI